MVTGYRDRGIRQTCRTFRFCIGTHTGWTVIRHRIVLCQQAQVCVRPQAQGHPASGQRSSGAVPGTGSSDRPSVRRNADDNVEEQLTLEDIFGGDDK